MTSVWVNFEVGRDKQQTCCVHGLSDSGSHAFGFGEIFALRVNGVEKHRGPSEHFPCIDSVGDDDLHGFWMFS